jgi:hypothetical protein
MAVICSARERERLARRAVRLAPPFPYHLPQYPQLRGQVFIEKKTLHAAGTTEK